MLDITSIRQDPSVLDTALTRRGKPAMSSQILDLDAKRRAAQTEQQNLQAKRNQLSKQVGELKAKKEDANALMDEVKALGPAMEKLAAEEAALAAQLDEILTTLPNPPAADVPDGKDEHDNVEVKRWGTPRTFDFAVKAHDDVAADLGMLDNATAAKIGGARFAWIQGPLARLERSIAQFFLDYLVGEKGFTEVRVPYLVNDATMFGTGQLPKFKEDLFQTTDGRWLIPTSEVPLTNLAQDRIFKADELPIRLTSWSPCFRSEAGSAGRDTKGLIRMHQFDKVEMVILAKPEDSEREHQGMVDNASMLLQKLGLPHRVITLCTGDMGFGATKTYDLEVWVPSQNTYREISSCSNCGDFQARRMKGRFKDASGSNLFIHTLNGSGLAVGRTLVAILENYQNADGSLTVPEALVPYMGGVTVIKKA